MEVAILYGVALVAFIVLIICRRVCLTLTARCTQFLRSHILYPLIWDRKEHTDNLTRLGLISLLILLGVSRGENQPIDRFFWAAIFDLLLWSPLVRKNRYVKKR
ncbi:uncharacterized protein F4822DRAFT_150529 [Hypoxylon trugodes]|uniref:uncharacterized protein n=1 Tax=Hypoxylon trugodes TaxID=326681 RepID=UPI0021A0806D|nr:uncharacterized protein F4822DRAFT_150529 [Hypoxylon trugodes]KAI1382562.1 hypothetical protein F4822DRAFT_150529 [Hypoxylon trugodes]